jgi:hypothetical protein
MRDHSLGAQAPNNLDAIFSPERPDWGPQPWPKSRGGTRTHPTVIFLVAVPIRVAAKALAAPLAGVRLATLVCVDVSCVRSRVSAGDGKKRNQCAPSRLWRLVNAWGQYGHRYLRGVSWPRRVSAAICVAVEATSRRNVGELDSAGAGSPDV